MGRISALLILHLVISSIATPVKVSLIVQSGISQYLAIPLAKQASFHSRIARASGKTSQFTSSWKQSRFFPLIIVNPNLCANSNNYNCRPCSSVTPSLPPDPSPSFPVIDPDLLPPGYSIFPRNERVRNSQGRLRHQSRSTLAGN